MHTITFFLNLWVFVFFIMVPQLEGKTIYEFTDEPIDVIIPTTKKDLTILEECIKGIKINGINVRRIIVISEERYTNNAEWYEEVNFPFQKKDVALYLCGGDEKTADEFLNKKSSRVGWYYQQLLKFYAPFVIPGISSNVLILDSDTVFLRPTSFVSPFGAGLYNPGNEFYKAYFEHIELLFGGSVKKVFNQYSGISHHMLFQKTVLEDLFDTVEKSHKMPFWKAFCSCVNANHLNGSGASEYEIYFNFVFSKTDQVLVRELKWQNIKELNSINKYRKLGFDYVSCHSWMRKYL